MFPPSKLPRRPLIIPRRCRSGLTSTVFVLIVFMPPDWPRHRSVRSGRYLTSWIGFADRQPRRRLRRVRDRKAGRKQRPGTAKGWAAERFRSSVAPLDTCPPYDFGRRVGCIRKSVGVPRAGEHLRRPTRARARSGGSELVLGPACGRTRGTRPYKPRLSSASSASLRLASVDRRHLPPLGKGCLEGLGQGRPVSAGVSV
jgi:hypothetical protein